MLTDISHVLTYSISFRATIGVIALGCLGGWFPAMDSVHATGVSGDELLSHDSYWCFRVVPDKRAIVAVLGGGRS